MNEEKILKDLKFLLKLNIQLNHHLLIVSQSGIDKNSFIIEHLETLATENNIIENDINISQLSGAISPIDFYFSLFKHKAKGNVIVINDADRFYKNRHLQSLLRVVTGGAQVGWGDRHKKIIDFCKITDDDIQNGKIPSRFNCKASLILIINSKTKKQDFDYSISSRLGIVDFNNPPA